MLVRPVKTRVFKERENLIDFIVAHIPKLRDGSLLVVTSKIVALAEGRTAPRSHKKKVIRAESEWLKKTKYGYLTQKNGMLLWNAGIDESNADGRIILLPRDSFESAQRLHTALKRRYRIRRLGVLITDSRILPLRAGVVGIALGYAGFRGLRDYRGQRDVFARALRYTQTDIADSLASAAVLLMGEGSERQPLAIVEQAPVEYTTRLNKKELLIAPEDDMYAPLFKKVSRKKR